MARTTSLLGALAVAMTSTMGMGCSHNPLVGTWTTAFTTLGFTGTTSYEVNGDGTIVVTQVGSSSSCSGSSVTTGYQWAATDSSITFSGTPVCNGSITCGSVSLSCSGTSGGLQAGSCAYALSNNDDTLALTSCSGTNDVTLTRTN